MSQQHFKRQPITPEITVNGALAALDYYKKYMSAKIIAKHPAPDGKKIFHAEIELPNGARVFIKDCIEGYGRSELDEDGMAHTSVALALHFNKYKDGKKFWDNFHCNENINNIKDECIFEPQYWNENYGRVRCKYGHCWTVLSPLDDNQIVPPNPFTNKVENKNNNNNKISGKKRVSMKSDENESKNDNNNNNNEDEEDFDIDEPPKKKQKLSKSIEKEKEKEKKETVKVSGFKEIILNGGLNYGLFVECNIDEKKESKISSAGQAYGKIWGLVGSLPQTKNNNPTTNAIAILKDGIPTNNGDTKNKNKNIRYVPGFLFDKNKMNETEVKNLISNDNSDNNNEIKFEKILKSDWYVYLHVGSYDNLVESYKIALNDIKKRGYKVNDNILNGNFVYELYLNEPNLTTENQWLTEINIAITK